MTRTAANTKAKSHPATFEAYVRKLPRKHEAALRQIRLLIKHEVPAARDAISYGIPSMTLGGKDFIGWAAWENHVSIYPVPDGSEALRRDMRPYRFGRGTLRFALDRPLPIGLIRRIVKASVKRAKAKGARQRSHSTNG